MMNRVSVTAYQARKWLRTKPRLRQVVSVSLAFLSASWATLPIMTPQVVSAQTLVPSPPCPTLSQIEQLEQEILPAPERDIVTANTVSQEGLSTPSLWWAKEQFDEFGGKLVTNWIAYQNEKRIDLVVNLQPWTILDYLGRYRFVNKFGTVARDYQYNIRVCDQQAETLATYSCNYNRTFPDCQILVFKSFGRDSLPVPRTTP